MTDYLIKDVSAIVILVGIISGLFALVFPAAMASPKVQRQAYLHGKFAALFWVSAAIAFLLIFLVGYIGFAARLGVSALNTGEEGQKIKASICSKIPGCASVSDPYLAYNPTSRAWYLTYNVVATGKSSNTHEVFEGDWQADVKAAISALPSLLQLVVEESGALRVTTTVAPKKGRK